MESWKNRSPVSDEVGTAEAALGRVGRAGVCEHDEGVACRRVDLIASYREKGKNLRSRKLRSSHRQAPTISYMYLLLYFPLFCSISYIDVWYVVYFVFSPL